MSEASARFGLPYIMPGQAQKEVFHNEALALIDAALHASVQGGPMAAAPPDPAEGQCWIVAAGAGGAWSGKGHALACWTGGGWRFVNPRPGMKVWQEAAGCWIHWTGTAWSDGALPAASLRIGGVQLVGPRLPAVPSPSDGTVIDEQARNAINALIATLKSHGLTE